MRFLCDQCKAKYQISDDKIAGKTVRMKCRKCGHMIEVRAEVTETSVANAAPAAATAGKAGGLGVGTPKPAGTRPAPPRKLATSLTSSGPVRTPAPGTHPSALAGAFQRNVAANPSGSVRPPPGSPDDSSALDLLSASANPWYVAINGVPVGPVRLSEIRKKAASGLVTETSLVWQEGLEEWRQVKTFPELASIVREAAATGRPSLVSPPPEGRASMVPRPAAGPAGRNNVVPIASRRPALESLSDDDLEIAEGDATRVDMSAGNLAAEAAQARAPSSLVAADPFAAPAPQAAAAPQMARPATAPVVVAPAAQAGGPLANPFAPTVQATSQASMVSPLSVAPPEPRRREVNYFGIAMIGFAMAFGIAGAVVGVPLYFRAKASSAPSASAVASTAAPSASIASSDLPPVGTEPVDSAAPVASGEKIASSGGHSSGGGKPATTAGGAKASDPSIADLLRGGGGGPTVGGGSGPSAGGGTSALSTSEIEGVVNNRKTGITRTCWERNNSNLSNANVTCHITIAANGTVSSSQADGSDPVVAKCIEQQVKGWTFPPSSGSTRVDLPFHFVRQ